MKYIISYYYNIYSFKRFLKKSIVSAQPLLNNEYNDGTFHLKQAMKFSLPLARANMKFMMTLPYKIITSIKIEPIK